MAKGKKRRRPAAPSPVFHVTGAGVDQVPVEDSIEGCLDEFENGTSDVVAGGTAIVATPDEKNPFPLSAAAEMRQKDHAKSWQADFRAWNNGGRYPPGLLPCFEVELARANQVKELSTFLLSSCRGLRMPTFERWLIDSKMEEKQQTMADSSKKKSNNQSQDCVIPQCLKISSGSSTRLLGEIQEHGKEQDEANRIVEELLQNSRIALYEMHAQALRCASQVPCKGDRIVLEHNSSDEDHDMTDTTISILYSRKKWKKPFCAKINASTYNHLKDRFLQTHKGCISAADLDNKTSRSSHAFHLLLLVVTMRYSSLSGGQLLNDLRGGGMQGAVHEEVFDVLRQIFPNSRQLECFASPLNANLPSFASAFYDIDWHFGSVGDFFHISGIQDGCCCEANPPFSPGFMDLMVDKMEQHLAQADYKDESMTFVIIVPTAAAMNDSKGEAPKASRAAKQSAEMSFQRMIQSTACRLHTVLPAREHGYVEGAQHLRPTKYKQSQYDTSVIIWQSKTARKAPFENSKFRDFLRKAFAERHSAELTKRQKL